MWEGGVCGDHEIDSANDLNSAQSTMSAARLALSSLQNVRSRAAAGQPTSPSLLRSSAVKRPAEGSPGASPQGSPGFAIEPTPPGAPAELC